jgi:hypothetical protein
MSRIIAIVDNDDLGLIEENEVLGASEKLKEVLVGLRMAKYYDDTKPRVGKGVTKIEYKPYPPDRQVFFNDSVYISKTTTTRVPLLESEITLENPDSEWEKLVTGLNAQ